MEATLKANFHLVEEFPEKGHTLSVEWSGDLPSSKKLHVIVEQLTSCVHQIFYPRLLWFLNKCIMTTDSDSTF